MYDIPSKPLALAKGIFKNDTVTLVGFGDFNYSKTGCVRGPQPANGQGAQDRYNHGPGFSAGARIQADRIRQEGGEEIIAATELGCQESASEQCGLLVFGIGEGQQFYARLRLATFT